MCALQYPAGTTGNRTMTTPPDDFDDIAPAVDIWQYTLHPETSKVRPKLEHKANIHLWQFRHTYKVIMWLTETYGLPHDTTWYVQNDVGVRSIAMAPAIYTMYLLKFGNHQTHKL